MVLLSEGISNPKTAKSLSELWEFGILHLAPARESGFQVCPDHSVGCAKACLHWSGNPMYFKSKQAARIRKTLLFRDDPHKFADIVSKDVAFLERRAAKTGKQVAVRLNGTSDLPWENVKGSDGLTLMETHPLVTFYDYTKSRRRMLAHLAWRPDEESTWPDNYSLTFSRSESNDDDVTAVLQAGGNIAVVFADKLPETWRGVRVIDGDKNDSRFTDPAGVIVGLTVKGLAGKQDDSGFVIR